MNKIIMVKKDCGIHFGFQTGKCAKCEHENSRVYIADPHFWGRALGETIEEFRLHERQKKGWN